MMRWWTLGLVVGVAAQAAPTLGPLQLSSQRLPCLTRLELTCAVTATAANPFDPRDLTVDASLRSPQGRALTVPAFLYQEATRRLDERGTEQVAAAGEPIWKVRFCPTEPGRWRVSLTARDATGTVTSPPVEFEATPGTGHGFLRRSADSHYFAYDDGTPYLPIGHNVAWAGKGGTFDFDKYLAPIGEAGGNLVRVWLQWDKMLSIEYKGPRSGCGRYDLLNAWRMDHVLDECRRLGLHVLFTLDSPEPYEQDHYWLGKLTGHPWTDFCAHNAANGGTLKAPAELYTTEEGRRLIRQRLRYIVARWGWDPNLFCWELWNELNVFPGWDKLVPEIAAWHREMAALLHTTDVNRHLVTTSFYNAEGHADIWAVPELDFTQSHVYGSVDVGGACATAAKTMTARYDRPHLTGEFGTRLDLLGQLATLDPEAVHLHNGLWAGIMAGDAGTPLFWVWQYLDRARLARVYPPLAKFCRDVPWTTAGFRPAALSLNWRPGAPAPTPRDLVLPCGTGGPAVGEHLTLSPTAATTGLGRFYLYGHAQAAQQKPTTIDLTLPAPTKLTLRIGRVWVLGILEIRVDGQQVHREELPAGPGDGPWKKSVLDPRWNIYGADYDKDVTLDLPAGQHQVALYNAGKDGITIDRLTVAGLLNRVTPHLRALGLSGRRQALLWVQNPDHCLGGLLDRVAVTPLSGARLTLAGVPAGPVRVAWWDTLTGEVTMREAATAGAAGLTLDLPDIATDVAAKLEW